MTVQLATIKLPMTVQIALVCIPHSSATRFNVTTRGRPENSSDASEDAELDRPLERGSSTNGGFSLSSGRKNQARIPDEATADHPPSPFTTFSRPHPEGQEAHVLPAISDKVKSGGLLTEIM